MKKQKNHDFINGNGIYLQILVASYIAMSTSDVKSNVYIALGHIATSDKYCLLSLACLKPSTCVGSKNFRYFQSFIPSMYSLRFL